MMKSNTVSVTGECVSERKCLKSSADMRPKTSPIVTETTPRSRKFPRISKTEYHWKSYSVLRFYTVLNRMILTMSLKTPSP